MLGWLFNKKKEPVEFRPVVVRKEVEVESTKKVVKQTKPTKNRYMCNSCGYRFSRSSSVEVNVCPYCGKRDLSPDQTSDAQKLVENAKDDERFMR